MTMASKHTQITSQAFPRKRNTTSENSRRAACVEAEGTPSPTPCSACSLADKTCWISKVSIKCSFCLFKNQPCSLSSDRELAELIRAHRSLNEQITQAQIHLKSALANLLSLQEQKKKLTEQGISGSRARSRTEASTNSELTLGSLDSNGSSASLSYAPPSPVQGDDLVLESFQFTDMLDFTAGTDDLHTADFEGFQSLGLFPDN